MSRSNTFLDDILQIIAKFRSRSKLIFSEGQELCNSVNMSVWEKRTTNQSILVQFVCNEYKPDRREVDDH